ncbi:MAG TPA: Hcp family type VI secretion system effector [Castellaniella sp.]|nr:Hcp family type VI secretion system effector [Castellaniella sp.]
MPMPGYFTLTGQTQGKIDGSCTIQGHEDTILVQGVDHTIEIPKSIQTGLPTGKRIHGPLTITKEIDKASPKLFQALTSGEQLTDAKLEYYRISPQGKEELYYTVEIKNAIITSMHKFVPMCLDPANKSMGHMEAVSFTYETIIETFTPDGIEAQDSWNAPKS